MQKCSPTFTPKKSRPFWTAQNDSLCKIVFGAYKDNTLPIPFVNVTVIRRIEDDEFRSFVVQLCIVYYKALCAKSTELKLNQKGILKSLINMILI